MSDRTLAKAIKLVEKFGHTVDRIERGKHYKLFLTTKSGKKLLTVSVSTSDGRAMKNNESLLKRWQL